MVVDIGFKLLVEEQQQSVILMPKCFMRKWGVEFEAIGCAYKIKPLIFTEFRHKEYNISTVLATGHVHEVVTDINGSQRVPNDFSDFLTFQNL